MQKHFILTLLLGLLAFGLPTLANKPPMITLNGSVKAKGEPLPFASVQIKSTSIGTASDANGDYKLEVPEGTHQLRIQALGYKPAEITLDAAVLAAGRLVVELEEDALRLEQVVVTADRDARSRKGFSVIVNALSNDLLTSLQSTSLSEG